MNFIHITYHLTFYRFNIEISFTYLQFVNASIYSRKFGWNQGFSCFCSTKNHRLDRLSVNINFTRVAKSIMMTCIFFCLVADFRGTIVAQSAALFWYSGGKVPTFGLFKSLTQSLYGYLHHYLVTITTWTCHKSIAPYLLASSKI